MKEKVLGIIIIANIHVTRLQAASEQMQSWMPLSIQKLRTCKLEQLGIFEIFTTRFAKLQDLMGAKLFPAIFELTKEPNPPKIFIDILNRLEKMEVLSSAEQWLTLREIRNRFTHDYPDDSQQSVSLINEAFCKLPELLNIFSHIINFIYPYVDHSA